MTTDGTDPAGGDDSVPEWEDDGLVPGGEDPAFDTSIAHQARIYDYLLGGKDNFAADRKAADAAIAAWPDIVFTARANRAFLGRVVSFLAGEAGIRQFLDIGTGIPTAGNTHQVAQDVAPGSRVVYVDYDPVVLAHARALMTGSPEGATDYIDADLRDTGKILAKAALTLDFSQPVAVTMLGILHVIDDTDNPYAIVARIMAALPPGSYLAISHGASDIEPDKMEAVKDRANASSRQQFLLRSHSQVSQFFHGLDIIEPGVVPVNQWRPAETSDRVAGWWGGAARKN